MNGIEIAEGRAEHDVGARPRFINRIPMVLGRPRSDSGDVSSSMDGDAGNPFDDVHGDRMG